ncbi:MAG: hypothetical protein QM817_27190 [Archangium sp.]
MSTRLPPPSTEKPRRGSATVADFRKLAKALPEVHEKPSYGAPSFFRAETFFARALEDGCSLAMRMTIDQREVMIAHDPETFFATPHYVDWPYVVVRLGRITKKQLGAVLKEAWGLAVPAKKKAKRRASR